MKNKTLNKHKSLKLAVATFMSAVVFTVSATPVFAHALPSALENENSSVTTINTFGLDISEGDILIIDENGMVHEGEIDPRIIPCNHDFFAVQVSNHDKNSDGGCTTVYYKGKRCSKCGYLVIQEKLGTATYKVCPH